MVMIRKYPKGQILLFEGDPLGQMFKLNYGSVKVYAITDRGEENILTVSSPPSIFPLGLLIGHTTSRFFYETITDCEVEMTDVTTLTTSSIMRQAIELYYEALHRIAALEAKSVSERAIATQDYLLKHGVNPTHQMIANAANATRESVSTSLRSGKGKNGKRKTR